MRITILFFLSFLMLGCASGQSRGVIDLGQVDNDLIINIVAAGSQMDVAGGTNVELKATVPISGLPAPMDAHTTRSGLNSGQSIKAEKVSGTVMINLILPNTQNVDVPEALKALTETSFFDWSYALGSETMARAKSNESEKNHEQ